MIFYMIEKIERYIEYCTGCGLCKSIRNIQFKKNESGFEYPILKNNDISFCRSICPAGGKSLYKNNNNFIWGKYESVYLGWATNDKIRMFASSGGVLTTIGVYLLKNKIVDGIIQSKQSSNCPYEVITVVSSNENEVKNCMGSRYSISSPLSNIKSLVKHGKSYAFIGKPCDVSAFKLYLEKDVGMKKQIKYLFSFFCAGQPSEKANLKLIKELGCKDIKDCKSLQYRGNGWPGFATIIKNDGTSEKMSYNDSWGKILGRDIRKSCRFCIDGIGEMADISCGDAWHITEDNKPDFSESKGRNIIFARTSKGKELLDKIIKDNYLFVEKYDINNLKFIQKYQYERKASMIGMILALVLTGKQYPNYSLKILLKYTSVISKKLIFRRFLGTLKRVFKDKI